MEIQLPLRVFKTRPYAWRTNLGGAHHAHMDAWNVEDANGVFLAGGLSERGSNVRTARAMFPRKREALAYVAAYTAWLKGEFDPAEMASSRSLGFIYARDCAFKWAKETFPAGGFLVWSDEQIERAFGMGALQASIHRTHPNYLPVRPSEPEWISAAKSRAVGPR